MADYHPLIARAVAGLEKNTGENRRVLYERARAALVNQLRGVEPALEEADITRERLALEEAIRKVEADAVKRAREEEPPAPERPATLTDHGLRELRATLAEAEGLGAAAAQANRAAREVYDAVPGADHAAPGHTTGTPASGVHYFEPPETEPPPVSEPDLVEEAPPMRPSGREGAFPPPPYEEETFKQPVRSWGGVIKAVVVVLILAALAGAGYWQRHTIGALIASFRAPPAKTQQAAAPAARPKITDRVGENGGPAQTATAPAAAVAQKVVLFDEDPNNPQGTRYVGSAIWRTETVSPGPGLAPELAVRADVEIPERHMRMTWSLRRNTDKALPASHTIEIQFTLPADFPEGGIGNVPGVLMKGEESGRGVPLTGLAVKVTNGYFLIGLSAIDIDVQRNIEMLKNRDWLDIPMVYTSGKRAILTLEKGTPGQRAFAEAFRAWGE
ncbi:MAG TPA: hypothetical protein VFA57_03590 [Pseudolabrys sp.]|nr:hypothetical protein [Pseudolabrys sp.]